MMFDDFLLWLSGALVVAIAMAARPAHSEPWQKVTFSEWPQVPVSRITEKEPFFYGSGSYGSVQPKKTVDKPASSICNQRTSYGYWLPVPCDFPRSDVPRIASVR